MTLSIGIYGIGTGTGRNPIVSISIGKHIGMSISASIIIGIVWYGIGGLWTMGLRAGVPSAHLSEPVPDFWSSNGGGREGSASGLGISY